MTEISLLLYNFFTNSIFEIVHLGLVVLCIIVIVRLKISGQKIARIGMFLFFCMILTALLGLDDIAKTIAQYVFVAFIISFVQEFSHFLRHENT